MIAVSDITKKYNTFTALRGVSFTIKGGEIVGLLGPNGAGKTTLIRILTGYHYPTSGSAIIADKDVLGDDREVKQQIGYLPENAPLYQDMYVYEYLRFIARARGVAKEQIEERIRAVVAECGLKDMLLKSIQNLSKGYRQRVGLAQAMIHDPPILIFDEPTNGLDPNQIIEIRNLIRALGKKKTVILSTHVMQEVEAICNRVLIINDGALVAQGTTTEIAAQLRGEERHLITFYDESGKESDAVRALLEEHAAITSVPIFRATERVGARAFYYAEVILGEHAAEGSAADGGAALFHWAIAEKMVLTSLTLSRLKLEEIFVRLTQ